MFFLDGGIHHVFHSEAISDTLLEGLLLTQILLIFALYIVSLHLFSMCLQFFFLLHPQYVIAESFTIKAILLSLDLVLLHLIGMTLFNEGLRLLLKDISFVIL